VTQKSKQKQKARSPFYTKIKSQRSKNSFSGAMSGQPQKRQNELKMNELLLEFMSVLVSQLFSPVRVFMHSNNHQRYAQQTLQK
jgi:hypothetical protein